MTDNKRDGEVYGLMLCFLCDLKNKILKSNGVDVKIDTGFLAAAGYIDRTINTLMSQQTTIAALQSELRIEKNTLPHGVISSDTHRRSCKRKNRRSFGNT